MRCPCLQAWTKPPPARHGVVGIPWYRREDYPRLRKIFADGNKLSPTYQEWLNLAQQTKKRLEGNGMRVI